MELTQTLAHLLQNFALEGQPSELVALSSGHIHHTYRLTLRTRKKSQNYILQKINKTAFVDIETLMTNVARICEHAQEWSAQGKFSVLKKVPAIIRTKNGHTFVRHSDASCYRLLEFVAGSSSLELLQNDAQAYIAAKAFADFERCLIALDVASVRASIAGFHDIGAKFAALELSVRNNRAKRLESVRAEVDFVLQNRAWAAIISEALAQDKLKLRVVHGDLKINNLLWDKDLKTPLSVIDLDTCMPGTLVYDFGDLIRSACLDLPEDEITAESKLSLSRIEALVGGFIEPLTDQLSRTELELLPKAPALIALTLGARFLSDYLDGDKYFKVREPSHNQKRARSQLALFKHLSAKQSAIAEILRVLCARPKIIT